MEERIKTMLKVGKILFRCQLEKEKEEVGNKFMELGSAELTRATKIYSTL